MVTIQNETEIFNAEICKGNDKCGNVRKYAFNNVFIVN